MLFPIGDDNIERGHTPFFSYLFLVANVVIFWYQTQLPGTVQEGPLAAFLDTYAVVPAEITSGIDLYTLLTNMFLHGSWMHLLGNMLFLWIFADNIEATVGSVRFVLFYLLSGLVASVAQVVVSPYSVIPCLGASGAIAGVMGAYIVMFPRSRVKMFFLLFFSVFYIPSWVFLGFWFFQQMNSGLNMLNVGGDDAGGIAWWAHIGGFVFGLAAGLTFRRLFLGRRTRPAYEDDGPPRSFGQKW